MDAKASVCAICASIPDDLTVNTGRQEYFPEAADALVALKINPCRDVRQCPDCEALFEWIDMPQYYGSGNNDEERLVRLNEERASMARILLGRSTPESHWPELDDILRILGPALTGVLLESAARKRREIVARYIDVLLQKIVERGDGTLYDIIAFYCGDDRTTLNDVVVSLDAAPSLDKIAEHLRNTLRERLMIASKKR